MNQSFNNSTNLNLTGCFGCLGYIALYASASYIIATIEWQPLWAWALMIVYVMIWATAMFWQYKKGQAGKEGDGQVQ